MPQFNAEMINYDKYFNPSYRVIEKLLGSLNLDELSSDWSK